MSTMLEKVTRLRNMLHRRMKTGGYVNAYAVMQKLDDIVRHGEKGAPHPAALKFPRHLASLTLTHNQHKDYYQTVEQSVASGDHGYSDDCWISPEQKALAIERDECWMLQVYPDTPVGFYILSAAELGPLLAHANRED